MKNIYKKLVTVLAAFVLTTSCSEKLDLFPQNDLTPEKAYKDEQGYMSVLAKIYGSLSLGGNGTLPGVGDNRDQPDITGLDEGSQIPFIRPFFNMQELPTDEAVVAWNDQTIKNFHNMNWTSTDPFIKGMYARPIWNVALINEFIREAADAKIAQRGITGTAATNIKTAVAEAKFLRAFNYWVAMDLFGRYSFITEKDPSGTTPNEILPAELFKYIESELLGVEELLPTKTSVYGRVDRTAAQALLARLYLNAKTYTGSEKLNEAATYAKKVIDSGYSLSPTYSQLFQADNHNHTNEIIWAINCDGLKTRGYGNTTFLVHAASGDDAADYNIVGGWFGYRATTGLSNKFYESNATTTKDLRALFTTSSFGIDPKVNAIDDISKFANGVHVFKWTNNYVSGAKGNDAAGAFVDTDFPIFRLPEMYLIYAEAVLRGANTGNLNTALSYINQMRTRAYGNASGNISVEQITLQFILDERSRELYWEGHRRTDLIRYNQLVTDAYLWPWKGGVANGRAVETKYNIYPIPSEALNVNSNLNQNSGY